MCADARAKFLCEYDRLTIFSSADPLTCSSDQRSSTGSTSVGGTTGRPRAHLQYVLLGPPNWCPLTTYVGGPTRCCNAVGGCSPSLRSPMQLIHRNSSAVARSEPSSIHCGHIRQAAQLARPQVTWLDWWRIGYGYASRNSRTSHMKCHAFADGGSIVRLLATEHTGSPRMSA